MILRLAFRNILGNGWRSLVNMLILCIVLIGIFWTQGMYHSWMLVAETQQIDWEYGKGLLRVNSYDPYDAFSWDSSYAQIPPKIKPLIEQGEIVPVLYSPATIYPQGRMMQAMVKGISSKQNVLKFPTLLLDSNYQDVIPVVIGSAMARSSRLQKGDVFSIRIKDVNGAFNALDAEVVEILSIPVPTADIGTVWVNIEDLQKVKLAHEMASHFVLGKEQFSDFADDKFRYIDKDEYFADLYQIRKSERSQEFIMYGLLLFLAMIAIFDTQALAVFKRRKEIGTLSALGLPLSKITLLFTLEGVMYMVFASILSAVLGFPLFWYFAKYGYRLPKGYEDFGIQGFSEPIYFTYPLGLIFATLLFVFVLTAIISWIPTRKIAKLNPTDALRGKVN